MSEAKPGGTAAKPPVAPAPMVTYPLGAAGALVGAGLGVLVLYWGMRAGLYAELMIGVLSGLGAGFLSMRGGWIVGGIAGVVTAVVGVWAEWKYVGAFKEDDSLGYFVTHFYLVGNFKMIVHGIGVAAAVWLGARK